MTTRTTRTATPCYSPYTDSIRVVNGRGTGRDRYGNLYVVTIEYHDPIGNVCYDIRTFETSAKASAFAMTYLMEMSSRDYKYPDITRITLTGPTIGYRGGFPEEVVLYGRSGL